MRVAPRRASLARLAGVLAGLLVIGCGSNSNSRTDAGLTTRSRTVRPVAVPAGAAHIAPREVALYAANGYSAWQYGPGEDQGRRLDLMPAGYAGSPDAGRLTSFFTLSDVHITDKESPAQLAYFGWAAPYGSGAAGISLYTPSMLATTQVLDAAVRTINAVHAQTPLNFGVVLGDMTNSGQYNELRWFVDVLDGKFITPSSGAHAGADTIDYQRPFQAAGLNPAIPWYAVAGNHDQFWMGGGMPNDRVQAALVGSQVLSVGTSLADPDLLDKTGVYVGAVDGTTPYGDVVKGGLEANYAVPPTVAADADRRMLTTAGSTLTNLSAEMANSTSVPAGHGLASASRPGCYSFEPVSGLPLKIIVFDDTNKRLTGSLGPQVFASGDVDAERYAWLADQLQAGQAADQLMIVASHIPIGPQASRTNTAIAPQFDAGSQRSDADLIALLHNYPNLLMVIAGHRHQNTVTPQPSPDAEHPELGFWEVETPSLRDFPQQFRTFEIRRNADNTISMVITDVDPMVEEGSPAAKSRGYALGACRVFGVFAGDDTSSRTVNAELVKQLTPAMQARIAAYAGSRRP